MSHANETKIILKNENEKQLMGGGGQGIGSTRELAKKVYERVKIHNVRRRGDLIFKNHFNTKTLSKMMEQARGGKLRILLSISHWLVCLLDSPCEKTIL